MKELLKAYVNSVTKLPEEQMILLSDDLLYSYFKKRLTLFENNVFPFYRGDFDNYELKLFKKFMKNANEKEVSVLLEMKFDYINYIDFVDEKTILNYFEKLMQELKITKDGYLIKRFKTMDSATILKYLSNKKYSDDFILKMNEISKSFDEYRFLYLYFAYKFIYGDKNISIRLKYHGYCSSYEARSLLENRGIEINPNKELSKELLDELISFYSMSALAKCNIKIPDAENMIDNILSTLCDFSNPKEGNDKFEDWINYVYMTYTGPNDDSIKKILNYKCPGMNMLVYLKSKLNTVTKGVFNLFFTYMKLMIQIANENPWVFAEYYAIDIEYHKDNKNKKMTRIYNAVANKIHDIIYENTLSEYDYKYYKISVFISNFFKEWVKEKYGENNIPKSVLRFINNNK